MCALEGLPDVAAERACLPLLIPDPPAPSNLVCFSLESFFFQLGTLRSSVVHASLALGGVKHCAFRPLPKPYKGRYASMYACGNPPPRAGPDAECCVLGRCPPPPCCAAGRSLFSSLLKNRQYVPESSSFELWKRINDLQTTVQGKNDETGGQATDQPVPNFFQKSIHVE